MPPNVLLITCHDLGCHLGCYGVGSVHTPAIDALAASGIKLTQAFCSAPTCSPSRAGLFTGRTPHSTGCLGLTHGSYGWGLHDQEQHLAQRFADGGYETALFGIMHEDQRFERWGYQTVRPFDEVNRPGADDLAAQFDGWVESRSADGVPFMAHVGFFEPHHPFEFGGVGPDKEHGVEVPDWLVDDAAARRELAMYQGAIRKLDGAIERLMQTLENAGIADDTLVVFTTDHGIPFPRAKATLYDAGLTTALLVRWPGRGWVGGGERDALLSNLDIMPMLLEACALPVPDEVHGRSFAALLDGQAYEPNGEIFAEQNYHGGAIFFDPRRALRTTTHKLIANFTTAPPFMGDGDVKAQPELMAGLLEDIQHGRAPEFELYDLRNDPAETRNLAKDPDHQAVFTQLKTKLHTWMTATDDPLLQGYATPRVYHDTMNALRASSSS